MKRGSLSTIISTPVLMAIFSLTILNLFSLVQLNGNVSDIQRIETEIINSERLINDTLQDFKTQIQEWKNVLLRGHSEEARIKYWQRFKDREHDVTQAISLILKSNAITKESRDLLVAYQTSHKRMSEAYRKGYAAFEKSNFDHVKADEVVRGIDREPTKLLQSAAEKIRSHASQEVKDIGTSAQTTFVIVSVLVLLFTLVAPLGVLNILRVKVIKPIKTIIKGIDALAKRNYSTKLDYESHHELGHLASSVKTLQSNLSQAVRHLEKAEGDVSQGFSTLSEINKVSAAGAQKQTNTSEYLEKKVAEMSGMTGSILEQVSSAHQITNDVAANTHSCSEIFSSANTGFKALVKQVSVTSDKIEELKLQSDKISSVTNVIRGITEQTNLLALNAAIEAARAGEHGRGFAVVADEVRSLATKTQGSTEEIETIISLLTDMINDAVKAMHDGMELTKSNMQESEHAMGSLNQVVEKVSMLEQSFLHLTAASKEQQHVSDSMNRVVSDVIESAQEYIKLSNSNDLSTIVQNAHDELKGAVSELASQNWDKSIKAV